MYYLFVKNLGTKKCISKNSEDIYTPNMNIHCGPSQTHPNNILLVRDNSIRCTNTGNNAEGEVYCDYFTGVKLKLK